MEVEINIIGVLVGTAVSMIVGSVWYSRSLFGKDWMKLENIDEKKMKTDSSKAMAGMLLLAFIMSYVLAHVAYLSYEFFVDDSFQTAAVTSGFWMWLGFVLPVSASNSLFNQKPWKLSAIHAGNWLVTLLSMGLVIGAVGLPS